MENYLEPNSGYCIDLSISSSRYHVKINSICLRFQSLFNLYENYLYQYLYITPIRSSNIISDLSIALVCMESIATDVCPLLSPIRFSLQLLWNLLVSICIDRYREFITKYSITYFISFYLCCVSMSVHYITIISISCSISWYVVMESVMI